MYQCFLPKDDEVLVCKTGRLREIPTNWILITLLLILGQVLVDSGKRTLILYCEHISYISHCG